MAITITRLRIADIDALVECFNHSFSDYIFPRSIDKELLKAKIDAESIKLSLSAGAWDDGKLVGFILHGFDVVDGEKIVYNAGTGVIPGMRGNKLSVKMYQYALPELHSRGMRKIRLEVIPENIPALRIYEQTSFKILRELHCFKGPVQINNADQKFRIEKLTSYNWELLESFWDWIPSWQNETTAVENLVYSNVSLGIYENDLLIGYLVYNPDSKRIQQFAISRKYRNRGAAKQLFAFIAKNYGEEMSVINVDATAKETISFLNAIGLSYFVRQYEMEMKL